MEAVALFRPPQGQSDDLPLPRELQFELWSRISGRLEAGASLITPAHFQRAMEAAYLDLVGAPPSEAIKSQLGALITAVNSRYPETYLSNGAHNAISKAFRNGVDKLQWDLTAVQAKGAPAIRRFLKGGVRLFCAEQGLDVDSINPVACVQPVARQIAATQSQAAPPPQIALPPSSQPPAALWHEKETPPVASQTAERSEAIYAGMDEAIRAGQADEALREHMHLQARWHAEILEEEKGRIPKHLDTFVQRGLLTNLEAHNLHKIYDGQQGRRHNSAVVLAKLEEKLKPALDEVVFYLEVFEALKRIPTARDEVLRFLIRFRERVGASDQGADLQPVIEQLRQDPDLLASAMEIAECKDQEIRLIGLRLHPYGRAVQRDERIGQVEMAEDFVDELRVLGREQLSSLLNHTDPEKRQNLIAAAKTLIRLIDQLTELTPFCQEVRILHIVRDVEEIYATASSRREGREQVKHFLEHRLHLLYPDLTAHERATIERGAAALQQRDKEKEKGFQKRKILQDRESDLSAREVKLGVRFARVEVSLGGQSKRVPYKIMEDADHPGAFIVVRTDPKTGEVVPALRHGEKRYVEKNKEGFWKMAS